MSITPDSTLREVKEHLRDNYEDGCKCPACGQLVKLYKRKFNSGMARVLIAWYKLDSLKMVDDKWVMVSRELLSDTMNPTNLEYSKLAHWKLIESRGDEGENTKSAGYWRLTDRGREFAASRRSIPKYVHLYDGKVEAYSAERTTIKEALGDKFSYSELMRGDV